MKRLLFFLISAVCLFAAYQWSSDLIDDTYISALKKSWSDPSPFTDNAVLERQLVYKGKSVSVLYNYKPLLPGHLLIIPQRQAERLEDVSDQEWLEIKQVIEMIHQAFTRAYHAPDYVLILQNGLTAGQTVPHMHFHMFPRNDQSIVYTKFLIWKNFLTEAIGLRSPLSKDELQKQVNFLKEQIGAVNDST